MHPHAMKTCPSILHGDVQTSPELMMGKPVLAVVPVDFIKNTDRLCNAVLLPFASAASIDPAVVAKFLFVVRLELGEKTLLGGVRMTVQ